MRTRRRSHRTCGALVIAVLLARCTARTVADDAGSDGMSATPDVIVPPGVSRQLAPLSTSSVTSHRPTLRWQLAPGNDGAHVVLCRDLACRSVVTTVDAVGSSLTVADALSPGIYFWRLAALTNGMPGTAYGPAWEFNVGARGTSVDTSWGSNGDLNGDGFTDIVVGAWGVNGDRGAAFVYHGSAVGIATEPTTTLDGPDGMWGQFGHSVARAGDVNGDGFGDVVVGAYQVANAVGRAYVFAGSARGLAARPIVNLAGPDGDGGGFGYSVASAGDVNADGFADLIVGAPFVHDGVGSAYVFFGSEVGERAPAAVTLVGPDGPHANFGGSVAGAGDVNGDGFGDVIVAAYPAAELTGRVYIYLGSATGIVNTPASSLAGTGDSRELFGVSVACADDVNGDGYADVIVGASGSGGGLGRADLYLGGATGLGAMPSIRLVGMDGMYGGFGGAVAGAGDTNGDGFADVLVAAAGAARSGRAYVFAGSAAGVAGTVTATLSPGTDASGVFGAPAGSGDLNGDGFADVIVADQSMYGSRPSVFAFAGSATGIATEPTATVMGSSDPSSSFGASIALFLRKRPSPLFSRTMSSRRGGIGSASRNRSDRPCRPEPRT